MKTNFTLLAMLACALALTFTSCGGDDGPGPDPGPGDPGGTTYNVTVSVTGNAGGTAKATVDGATVTKAAAGTTVTIEATPAANYEFTGWTVTGGGAILSSLTTSTTTFTMPSADVSVEASFAKPEPGAVINGVTWSTRNVDAFRTFAATPQSAGMFYQWNRSRAWASTGTTVSGWPTTHEPGDIWTAANDPCPTGWRMPTKEDFDKLIDEAKVEFKWVTTPAKGYTFTDKTSNVSIFLPAAGCRIFFNGDLSNVSTYGYYWSSTPRPANNIYAYSLRYYDSIIACTEIYARAQGSSVRCVKK